MQYLLLYDFELGMVAAAAAAAAASYVGILAPYAGQPCVLGTEGASCRGILSETSNPGSCEGIR